MALDEIIRDSLSDDHRPVNNSVACCEKSDFLRKRVHFLWQTQNCVRGRIVLRSLAGTKLNCNFFTHITSMRLEEIAEIAFFGYHWDQ